MDSGLPRSTISLFSGAGGLDLGVEQAGFDVVAAVEMNDDAARTMEANFSGLASEVIRQDIRELSAADLRAAAGLGRRERPGLLVGGPPCVAFSKSGFYLDYKREGRDPAAGLLQNYADLLHGLQPDAFIFENVYALTFKNKASSGAFAQLLERIRDAKYQVAWRVLNCADYGVPQLRPRVFVIGTRKEFAPPALPEPTHGGMWEKRQTGHPTHPHVTTSQAFEGLPDVPEPEETVGGKYGHLLADIPPGENYLFYTEKRGHPNPLFEWRSRYWSFLLKLDPDRPSPTIQAQPGPYVGPFHWESRRLRVPEVKRLFTFPDEFTFVGKRGSVQRQLGNCVPPLVARRVAEAVAASLRGDVAPDLEPYQLTLEERLGPVVA